MRYIKFLIIVFLALISLTIPVIAWADFAYESRIEARQIDKRTKILQAYLAKYNSPLEDNALDFIQAADKYKLDWRFVAAISGVESTFGKFVPGGRAQYTSYNAWGWGVYGNQAIYFKSWQEGIYTVTEGLRKNYFDKGLTEPYAINRVYAASPTWGSKVTYFLNDIEKFQKEFEKDNPTISLKPNLTTQTAGRSGVISLK